MHTAPNANIKSHLTPLILWTTKVPCYIHLHIEKTGLDYSIEIQEIHIQTQYL